MLLCLASGGLALCARRAAASRLAVPVGADSSGWAEAAPSEAVEAGSVDWAEVAPSAVGSSAAPGASETTAGARFALGMLSSVLSHVSVEMHILLNWLHYKALLLFLNVLEGCGAFSEHDIPVFCC